MVATLTKKTTLAETANASPVGLDVGNGSLKLVGGPGEFKLDSYVCYLKNRLSMAINSGYVEYLEGSRNDLIDKQWIGGINAYYHSPRGLARVTDNKFGKVELGLQILLSGLSTMPYRPELNLALVASVHDGKTLASGLRKALTGNHLIRIQNKECRINIEVISVLEEGTGAVLHYQNKANFSNAILYDLGNGTLIVSSFNGLNMTHRSYSQNGGVESLIDAIAANDHVRSKLLREGDRHLIRAGIEDSSFSYGTQYPSWTFAEAYKEELPRWVHGVLAPMVRPTEDRSTASNITNRIMINSPRKNASQQSVWQWVTLKFDPTEPTTTNPDWQAQHSALVVFENGGEQRIYFNPGLLSRLRKGDTVLCHYRRGKWRLAFEQPPELMKTLESRTVAPGERDDFNPPQPDPRPTAPPLSPTVATVATVAKTPSSHDVREIVGIFQELKAALPEAQETTVRAFSSTLFMQRRKDEPEF